MQFRYARSCAALLVALALFCPVPDAAWAHCDSLEGPVVQDARLALERSDAAPVLKWVRKEHEGEIRDAFKRTMAVRTKGDDARALADLAAGREYVEAYVDYIHFVESLHRLAAHGASRTHHETALRTIGR